MKTLFTLSLISLVTCISFSQIPRANIHEKEHHYYDFNGSVKSCEIRNQHPDGEYHWSMINNTNQDLNYDKEKKLTERITYNINGLGYSDSIYKDIKWDYEYNGENSIQKVIVKDIAADSITKLWSYTLAKDTSILKTSTTVTGDTLTSYKIVEDGNTTSFYKLSKNNEYKLKSKAEFDDEKRITSNNSFNKEEKLTYLSIHNYKLDSLNQEQIIEYKIKLRNNSLSKMITYNNEHGLKVKRFHYDDLDNMTSEAYYEYKFDEQNNWIERTSKWRTKKSKDFITHITRRIIEYY